MNILRRMGRWPGLLALVPALLASLAGLTGCAHPGVQRAEQLAAAGLPEQALEQLQAAWREDPALAGTPAQKQLQARLQDRAAAQLVQLAEAQRAAGRLAESAATVDRLRALQPRHPRLAALQAELDRAMRHQRLLAQAAAALGEGRAPQAETLLREVAAEAPAHPGLRPLQRRLSALQSRDSEAPTLGPAFQKPVSLEFRDAPLRSVFEALSRSSGVNFVLDRDVRPDLRISTYLRQVTLDEALRVVLGSHGLDRKVLGPEAVLVYPATTAKQREHQELVTRTLYLANADARQAQALLRTIAKVREVHVDERLNALVIRETPEVVALAEKLLASVDLPEPEVMLEVEVMEVASDRLDALGLQWPEQVSFGLPGAQGSVELSRHGDFRASITSPALVAMLRGSSGQAQLLANPRIRVRNRDKAKVHIGEKLPIFTTTSTANVGVSASVNYLDVGLKLDVEPQVGLDGDVTLRVGLEVSNLVRAITGPAGSIAYQVGTRLTSTSLRLADGETQVISGLVNDEDRRNASGLPGLSQLPLVGALFGVQSTNRTRTEVVLLVTPRILRAHALPDLAVTRAFAGTDANPGAFSTQLRPAPSAAEDRKP